MRLETMGWRSSAAGEHDDHGESFFGMMGLGCANCPVTLWSHTRAQEVTGLQLISPLAWMPLARDILPSKLWKNVPKLSPTDL